MRTERWTGAAGLALVVVVVAGIVFESMGPSLSMSPAQMAASFKSAQGTVLIASAILLAQKFILVVFTVGLAALVARSEKDRALFGLILISGGLQVGLTTVYVVTYAALATVADRLPVPVVFGIFTVGDTMDIAGSAFLGVMFVAGAYGLARMRLTPRWQARLGFVAGGLMVVASFGILSPQSDLLLVPLLLSILLGLIWLTVASVSLVRAPGSS